MVFSAKRQKLPPFLLLNLLIKFHTEEIYVIRF